MAITLLTSVFGWITLEVGLIADNVKIDQN